ncbi:MAG: hypothetical protein WKF36_04055 [Candidatus Nitrosocosmicus sp.]
MLVFQTAFLSMFLIVLHKKLDKTIQDNRRSFENFIDRANKLHLMVTNLSDIVSNNNRVQEETHSNVAAVAAATIPPKDPYILEGTHPISSGNNNDNTSTENAGNTKDNLKGSLDMFSTPHPPTVSPQTSTPLSSTAQTEKSEVESYVDSENDLDSVNDHKDNTHKPKQPEFDNSSVKELKSLENEILCALKRLEKTKSHLAVEQGQETEQERETKAP